MMANQICPPRSHEGIHHNLYIGARDGLYMGGGGAGVWVIFSDRNYLPFSFISLLDFVRLSAIIVTLKIVLMYSVLKI